MTRLRWLVALLAFGLLASSIEVSGEPSAVGYDTPAAAVAFCPPPDELNDQEAADPPLLGCPAPSYRAVRRVDDARAAPLAGVTADYDIRAPPAPLQ
ncbi:MAG TPA: hypothetical protein VF210_07490 [Pseudomonadales bacterium]